MNMKQYRYALILAEEGSFSRAADILNISQPSLSQYIKKIECGVGEELFTRLNGSVQLTDAGRVYIEIGKKILDLEKNMQNRIFDVKAYKTGTVVIGTTPFRSVTLMPRVIAEFKKRYPGICIIVDERGTLELLEATEKGEVDVSIVATAVDSHCYDNEIIMLEEIVLAVPKDGSLDVKLSHKAIATEDRTYSAIDATLLDKENFVVITDGQIMQNVLVNLCEELQIVVNKSVVVKSLEAQIEMVRNGLGAAIVPIGVRNIKNADREISYYSIMQELPKREVVAIYRKGMYLSEPVRELISIMQGL